MIKRLRSAPSSLRPWWSCASGEISSSDDASPNSRPGATESTIRCASSADCRRVKAASGDAPAGLMVERTFTIGDGVQDVRTTPGGDVWVSYFDEGVFGNYRWSPPGPEPIGAPGLVAFDPLGNGLSRPTRAVGGQGG
jgi:hypothetical protein